MSYDLEGPVWGSSAITWSFAAAGGVFTNAITGAYQATVEQALATWAQVAGVTFQQVSDGVGADIRIGWGQFSGTQVGETDYSYSLGSQEQFLPGVTVRLEDPAARAISATPGAYYAGTSTNLLQVALHELGHALGLAHTTDSSAIMYPTLGPSNTSLDASDISGAQALYGPSAVPTTTQLAVTMPSLPPAASLPSGQTAVYRFFDAATGTQFLTADVTERNTVISTRPDLVYEGMAMPALSAPSSDPGAVAVYRYFDTSNGTHFFTSSASEVQSIAVTRPDLVSEGVAFYEDGTAQPGDTPVYRFFDSKDGTHFYSDSASEVANLQATRPDMILEGVAFYAPGGAAGLAAGNASGSEVISVSDDTVGLYSFTDSKTGALFLTSDTSERNALLSGRPDLIYDGATLKGVDPNAGDPAAAPVYRLFDTANGSHFFTTSADEARAASGLPGMVDEGVGFYAHAAPQSGDTAMYRLFDSATGGHLFTDSAAQVASIEASKPGMVNEGVAFWMPTS